LVPKGAQAVNAKAIQPVLLSVEWSLHLKSFFSSDAVNRSVAQDYCKLDDLRTGFVMAE